MINKNFILAHGVFDLFHIGHKRHLDLAKTHADYLVVSITGDKYVKKGPDRPIFNSNYRAELISSLEFNVVSDALSIASFTLVLT